MVDKAIKLEFHCQMQFNVIPKVPLIFRGGLLTPLQELQSVYSKIRLKGE